jgi:hypothetical protein
MEVISEIARLCVFLTPIVLVAVLVSMFVYFFKKEPIYMYKSTGWLDVKQYPIPTNITWYLATDGERVDNMFRLTWGPHGQLVFDKYEMTYITHWMPYPAPPKRK